MALVIGSLYQFMDSHPQVTVGAVGDGGCLEVGSLCLDENQSLLSFLILSRNLHSASAHSSDLWRFQSQLATRSLSGLSMIFMELSLAEQTYNYKMF